MSMPESVPRQLFHYTNQAGLLGMVKTKRMWASNIWYLNDLTESQLAVDLLTQRCGHFAELDDRLANRADAHLTGDRGAG